MQRTGKTHFHKIKFSILPFINVPDKDLGQVFSITDAPVVGTRKIEAFQFHYFFQAFVTTPAFQFVVLLPDIDVKGFDPIILHPVQLAVLDQLFFIERTPGTQQIVIRVKYTNPFHKILDDIREKRRSVYPNLIYGGQLAAKQGQSWMDDRADKTVERTEDFAVAVDFDSTNFNDFLNHVGWAAFPAGCFQVENDKIHCVRVKMFAT